jgi:hypothetical protein
MSNEIEKTFNSADTEQTYTIIRNSVISTQSRIYTAIKYTLPEDNKQVFAAKYMTCIPSEEEFKRELNLNDFKKLDDRV